ncbi:MAG: hypothetical protein QOG53_3502 [Frankiales bacterium]|jgi:hypothetical protein|nr:hypothetical protein [Frankiales bacterium]
MIVSVGLGERLKRLDDRTLRRLDSRRGRAAATVAFAALWISFPFLEWRIWGNWGMAVWFTGTAFWTVVVLPRRRPLERTLTPEELAQEQAEFAEATAEGARYIAGVRRALAEREARRRHSRSN